ncbi:MAG: FkbM family methyltransferase [Burkholderiales bacterium]|nr:FkbM family methyltransferase [Burkholderiales bacterium]MDE1925914.1 FkbM family methyltransferase [Burkholderiales bacterium]MDE2157431.1 FkbM family methyltransferase [Burkholderiales bacterium]
MTAQPMHPARRRGFAGRVAERLERGWPWRVVRWMALGEAQQTWYLRRLLRLLDVDLVVDVGANRGQFAHLLRTRVGYRGALISVEPIPDAAATLRRKAAADRDWGVVEAALLAQPGPVQLHVTRSNELSSLLAPSNERTDSLLLHNQVERRIEAEGRTLDDLLDTHELARGKRSIYLKLDVQGAELEVLRGGGNSLPRVTALQAEFSVIPLYVGVPAYHDQLREIERLGYQLSFVPAHNYTQFPDMIDFDAHFVRRSLLEERGYLLRPRAGVPSEVGR